MITHEKVKKKDIIINHFLGGVAWGVGTVIGATVIVGVVGYILTKLGVFKAISSFLGNL